MNENMSDCNVGSRKKRNMKDHLLIIHGIINSVVNGNEECIDIQIYDLEKAFDGLWLEDCLNDIYDNTHPRITIMTNFDSCMNPTRIIL